MTPLVALVGPTASGKSALALALAERLDLEILCADSRTVYRELSIGAAKPSAAERAFVPHHLLDLLELDELLTGPAFTVLADRAAQEVAARGRLPLAVGGTRLFVDGLLYELERQPLSEPERRQLSQRPLDEVQAAFRSSRTSLPLNHWDRDTLLEALDENRVSALGPERRPFLLLGVRPEDEALGRRVRRRVRTMLDEGLEEEVRDICHRHDRSPGSLFSIGYEEWQGYFEGKLTRQAVLDLIVENTLHYAFLQERWLEERPVRWVRGVDEAYEEIARFSARSLS